MKKRVISLILAVLMLTALTACGGDADRIAQLEAENAALKAQVEELTAKLEASGSVAGLSDWYFESYAWGSSNGANVTFVGTPVSYTEGMQAEFTVWLEGDMSITAPCEWNGSAFVASVDLNAADGYCYYCTLYAPDGTKTEVELNTPKSTTNEDLVNMETALTSYCAMMVEESKAEGNTLTLSAGYAQVQLPRIGLTSDPVAITGSQLILESAGKEIARCDLTMVAGETPDRYAAEIAGIQFTVPTLEDDQQMDIRLEVTLSDGQTLKASGGSWFSTDGELYLVVG